jgi:transcriptional regulator with XRE-family HTH domain
VNVELAPDEIKARRLAQRPRMTQAKLGALVGVSGSAIGQYEAGQVRPSRDIMDLIVAVLAPELLSPLETTPPGGVRRTNGGTAAILAALREVLDRLDALELIAERNSQRIEQLEAQGG